MNQDLKRSMSTFGMLGTKRAYGLSKLLMFALVVLALAVTSCGSKKKLVEEETRKQELVQESQQSLDKILNNSEEMTVEEMQAELEKVKALNVADENIEDLIYKAEAKIKKEVAKVEAEKKQAEIDKAEMPKRMLNKSFLDVANAPNAKVANAKINEALNLCASDDALLLIIIAEGNGIIDYDRPTTVRKYLEYLKDTKNYDTKIKNVVLDANGKIKEVELIKK